MKIRFDPAREMVFVEAKLSGPAGERDLLMGLDTGATYTSVSEISLLAVGYDPFTVTERIVVTMGEAKNWYRALAF